MKKQAIVRGLILLSALLVLASCKKDGSSATAADANADPVLLLDAGAEPQAPLRYKIADGTTTKSNMDFTIATLATTAESAALSVVPGVRLHIVSGPAMATENGVKFEVNIAKAEAAVPQGVDPKLAEELRQSAAILDDVGGTVEMNDRGISLSTQLNDKAKSPDLPLRLLMMIVNARTTLSRVVLPAEPVGLGARWEARKELTLYGFKVQQVDSYTLVERVGDEIKLNVTVTQNALPQSVDFPEDGVSIAVEQMVANARGEIILNLNALESDAAAAGEATDKLTVTGPEGTEKVEVNEAFEIRMTNTTAFE
ncbi:MAG: hypothetical protein JRD92_14155 [Deltaproteobacteria bacterium]|nr:hypothetical protein [Deltaproteobacteria bacterium]MBW2588070.1 hypothetical protein [Deltaproteobacteria bacterium]